MSMKTETINQISMKNRKNHRMEYTTCPTPNVVAIIGTSLSDAMAF
jgi:hypothetical protein